MTPARYAIPLGASFRFVHEPLDCAAAAHLQRFVGRLDELDELVARLLLADGGAFLVTGYRGVGKSTFVNRVIQEARAQLPAMAATIGEVQLVDVRLNVPRAMDGLELMYHVLRGLYLRLSALGLLHSLDATLRRDLELAFVRTSRSIAVKTSAAIESTIGVTLAALPAPALGSPGITLGSKRTRGESHEIAYLAYDDKAAEYDLISIARRLSSGVPAVDESWRSRLRRLFNGAPNPRPRLKVLFVFDELDKIDDAGQPGAAIDTILGNLKTLFTTSGIAFLFVAGKDLHDRWLDDVGRGDSVYESVFSYALYLSPLWALGDPMLDPLLDESAFHAANAADSATAYAAFKKFLAFSGRGIPRRVLRKFNERVRWADRRPQLVFSRDDVRQFRFFADLYDALVAAEPRLIGELREEALSGGNDRKRLGLYYLVDWILLRGIDEFTLEDAVAASRRLSRLIAPAEEAAPGLIRQLLQVLLEHQYIEEVASRSGPVHNPPDALAAGPQRYRLTHKRLVEMGSLAGVVEQEAQVVIDEDKSQRFGGRYEVISVLGRGGMSTVYLAQDRVLGRQVAIKELLADLEPQPESRQRFRQEAEALSRLQHENIVRIYDVHAESRLPYIVMEFVEGLRLTDCIGTDLLGDEDEVLRIAHDMVAALAFIHQRGILWRDAKPGNIMITPRGRVVLLDFGISRVGGAVDRDTGMFLGTPEYSSPEQLRGEAVDVRSDIYCVGIVLYQMASGAMPFPGDASVASALRRVDQRPAPLASVSAAFGSVILKCLEPRKEDRYATAEELLSALPPPVAPYNLPEKAQQLLRQTADAERQEGQSTVIALYSDRDWDVASTAEAPGPELSTASLVMADGTTYPLRGERVRIGRSHSNDIVLAETAASRFHAELATHRDGWTLTDLNTRNATMLNGVPVGTSVVLRDGDAISIGETLLLYRGPAGSKSGAGRVRRADLYEFVEEIRDLAAGGPLEPAIEHGLARAIDLSRAERGFVMLADDRGQLQFTTARARGGVPLPGSAFSTSRKIPEEVFRSGEIKVVADLLDGDLADIHMGTVALGIRHVLCVPLSTKRTGERVGVLYLDSREKGALLSSSTRDALAILAVELAEVIRGGRLQRDQHEKIRLEHELKIAGVVQQTLQPKPEGSGAFYEISVRSIPCRAIGGDFCHYAELESGAFSFVLGDVAGKGPAAAMVGTFILGAFESHAGPPETPAQAVGRVNKALLAANLESRYATLFQAVLAPGGALTYCNAGHNSPILLRGNGAERQESAGMPVGLFKEAPYVDEVAQLVPGDLMVVFTDGVSEAVGPSNEEFGDDRILQAVQQHRTDSTAAIADHIVAEVQRFGAGTPAYDDVSVLVVRYRP